MRCDDLSRVFTCYHLVSLLPKLNPPVSPHLGDPPGTDSGPNFDSEKDTLRQFSSHPGIKEPFEPNFLVVVDEETYLAALANRIGIELRSLEESLTLKTSHPPHRIPIIPDDLFRWALVSLYLCYDLEIYLPSFKYHFRRETDTLVWSGCGPTHAGFHRSIYTNVRYHKNLTWPIDLNIMEQIVAATEIYYRPVKWGYDPISVALSCFWSAIYAIFPDQAYLSLSTILETLLTTGNTEVSHQIAERVAILVSDDCDRRIELYNIVKKLYNQRSKITHGNMLFSKGVINWGTSIMSAKTTIISMPDLINIAQIATTVLRSVLDNEILTTAFQSGGRRNDEINHYFLRQLFS